MYYTCNIHSPTQSTTAASFLRAIIHGYRQTSFLFSTNYSRSQYSSLSSAALQSCTPSQNLHVWRNIPTRGLVFRHRKSDSWESGFSIFSAPLRRNLLQECHRQVLQRVANDRLHWWESELLFHICLSCFLSLIYLVLVSFQKEQRN